MGIKAKIALKQHVLYLTGVLLLSCIGVFAQKIDTGKITLKPKTKVSSRIPQIKANIQPYKVNTYGYVVSESSGSNPSSHKSGKGLIVLKVYPNPVVEQLNINLRLEKESNLSIKISDLLGNEIVTLSNERVGHGEQTKTYNIPSKLNAGIYFLKIVANGEQVIKKISVL
ncbi:T9SS type A sorting domain-containing protein [Pedobacter sp. ASV28]|uniref:T9SS type A sorting domain-containing protein n=1 Tax=Pedobacter sp. ASV28 TaxID=2795123 RepID=UPI001E30689B|nr:T9SS type A sorting domain-containing protein [Pedobacter sp. ASV28]